MNKILRNASIRLKVLLAPAIALCGLLAVAMVFLISNERISQSMKTVGEVTIQHLSDANTLSVRLTSLHQRVYESMVWEAVGQRAEAIKRFDDLLNADLDAFTKSMDSVAGNVDATVSDKASAVELATAFRSYAKTAKDTLDIKSTGIAMAATYVPTLDSEYTKSQAILGKYTASQLSDAHSGVSDAFASTQRSRALAAFVAFFAISVSVVVTFVTVRAITRPLEQAAVLASALARGDLTFRNGAAATDATGRVLTALDQVAIELTQLVTGIQNTAGEIDTASDEIATGNADLSGRTEEIASALQAAAASIDDLSSTINLTAQHALQANQLARDASTVAQEGGKVVDEVVHAMASINGRAKTIAGIVGVIDGIAFQTNILALNAAVEAARAGEMGRGFAVVAGEVRSLAHRSAEASREIRLLIGTSVAEITTGVARAQTAGETMIRIVSSINHVSSTVDDISQATTSQAARVSQVNQSVAEMERNTQQNAAMVEQAAAATESLNSQTHKLVKLLGHFRV